MDWHQLWEVASAPDNVPIVGLIPVLIFFIYLAWQQAHANDELIEQLEADPALREDPSSQELALPAGLAKRSSRLALFAARRISGRDDCHHHSDGVVDHAECASGRALQSELDHEPCEGALVLPGIAGDAGVLRSMDRQA